MPGTAALGCIAGHVQEIALLAALGADIRGYGSSEHKSAFVAFPEGHAALRTDISLEFSLCRVAAKGARLGLFCFRHLTVLLLRMSG